MNKQYLLPAILLMLLTADGPGADQPTASWAIDSQGDWEKALGKGASVQIKDGMVVPDAEEATFSSAVKTFEAKRKLKSLVFEQSPVWDNWEVIDDITPPGMGNALVFLPVAPGDYYVMGTKKTVESIPGSKTKKKIKDNKNRGYHAWHSPDLKNWTYCGPVSNGKWVTTAEYADGKFFIYYDQPNDQDPHLVVDDNLRDGVVGKEMGMAFNDPSHGSDCAVFRDEDGTFHMIYEDWSPINAKEHAWDSPLAGHVTSPDGIHGFKAGEHPPAIDHRTKPTGRTGTYKHSSLKVPLEYEIHEPEQNAYGDYTLIKVGKRYHLFGDFHPAGKDKKTSMCIGRFTSDDINKEFQFTGSIGEGFHPDPSVGFAEGAFYIVMQRETDFKSPGPWVDGVEARAGVDQDGDGEVDTWTDWQRIRETYSKKPGFARIVDVAPAMLDTGSLPEGRGFQFEFKSKQLENGVQPIMDRVELHFEN